MDLDCDLRNRTTMMMRCARARSARREYAYGNGCANRVTRVLTSATSVVMSPSRHGGSSHVHYRPDIDGLRAIAVLGVLVYHLFPGLLPGGFAGVDIFFVISGYLITAILLRQQAFTVREFYRRRVLRILPALVVVLMVMLVAGWWLLQPAEYTHLGKHVVGGSALSANILLWREGGYFDLASDTKLLLHLWSLGVEEQFYLVWPIFILVLRRRSRALMPATLVLAALSLVASVIGTDLMPSAAFYLPMTRFWELAAGGVLAMAHARSPANDVATPSREAMAGLGLITLLLGLVVLDAEMPWPGMAAAVPVLGTTLVIAAGPQTTVARRFLSLRVVVWIGLISYPLYLWHWPLIAALRTVAGEEVTVIARVVVGLLAIALAALTYRWIETPFRVGRMRRHPAFLLVALALVAGLGALVWKRDGFPARSDAARLAFDPPEHPCPLGAPPHPDAALDVCTLTGDTPPKVAVVGDSHAAHLFAGLTRRAGVSMLHLAHFSCPPVDGIEVRADKPACRDKAAATLTYLESDAAKGVEIVVLSSYFGYVEAEDLAADHVVRRLGPASVQIDGTSDPAAKARRMEVGLRRYIERLQRAGKRVVLVLDVPEFPFFPNRCALGQPLRTALAELAMGGALTCELERERVHRRQARYRESVARLAVELEALTLIDPLTVLCDATTCPTLRDGRLLYMDSHHLSPFGSEVVAEEILKSPPMASISVKPAGPVSRDEAP